MTRYWTKTPFLQNFIGGDPSFGLLAAFVVLVFFTGGSSRPDVDSFVILYPVTVVFLGIAIWNLNIINIQSNGVIVTLVVCLAMLFFVYLIPMPPGLSRFFSDNTIDDEIFSAVGIVGSWQPLAVDPAAASSSLMGMLVPLTAVLLGVQIGRREKELLLRLLIAVGAISGVIGLIQSAGGIESSLYFYDITNKGSAVGLYANRNHHAVMLACLFPMLAVYASSGIRDQQQARFRLGIAIALGALLVPLILVTGSRAGLVLGLIAVVSVFVLYRQPKAIVSSKSGSLKFNTVYILIVLGVLALAAITIMMAKAESITRFTSPENVEDLRWQAWNSVKQIGDDFFPIGAGPGSLARLFQYYESDVMLGSTYLNQAHNDWLDVYLTLGLFGVILAGVAALYVARNMLMAFGPFSSKQKEAPLARLGIVIVSILSLASTVDYPLRTPSGAVLFVIGLLWMNTRENRSKNVTAMG